MPTVVAAGVDDATAAPTADVVSRLSHGRSLDLPGNHFTAVAAPTFTDAIVELARSPGVAGGSNTSRESDPPPARDW